MIKLEITENGPENHYLSLNFSEDLKFVSILGQSLLKHVGELSVCPRCNKIIEFIPQMRLRYEKTKFLDGEKPKTNEPPFLLI